MEFRWDPGTGTGSADPHTPSPVQHAPAPILRPAWALSPSQLRPPALDSQPGSGSPGPPTEATAPLSVFPPPLGCCLPRTGSRSRGPAEGEPFGPTDNLLGPRSGRWALLILSFPKWCAWSHLVAWETDRRLGLPGGEAGVSRAPAGPRVLCPIGAASPTGIPVSDPRGSAQSMKMALEVFLRSWHRSEVSLSTRCERPPVASVTSLRNVTARP
nr:uncharacterized protein LOC103352050 isoform X1 [Oryctolagus cuniculus]